MSSSPSTAAAAAAAAATAASSASEGDDAADATSPAVVGADATPWFGSTEAGQEVDLFSSVGYGGFPQPLDKDPGQEAEGEDGGGKRRQSTVWSSSKNDQDDREDSHLGQR